MELPLGVSLFERHTRGVGPTRRHMRGHSPRVRWVADRDDRAVDYQPDCQPEPVETVNPGDLNSAFAM